MIYIAPCMLCILCTRAAAEVDRTGFWGALTGILKRHKREQMSTAEDGIYLEDIDSDSMDPEELSQFFPSRYCVKLRDFPTKWQSGAAQLYFCPKTFDVVKGMYKECNKPMIFHHNRPKYHSTRDFWGNL